MALKFSRFQLLITLLILVIAISTFDWSHTSAQTQSKPGNPNPSASPTPRREELPQDSDEVVKVETNLTNIFFTAADKNKRFITTLKAEDIRVLEDGQPQEVFTFQQNIDTPLSIAILIDTSISEQFTLPQEKAAAQAFLESVMRPD